MNTKNILFATLCGAALTLASCDKFLEESPKSQLTEGTYYKTEQQARANVTRLYRLGAPTAYSNAGSAYMGPKAMVSTMLTGYFTNSYEGQEVVAMYARQLTRQDQTRDVSNFVNSIWRDSYQAINIANGAIERIPNIPMSEKLKTQLIAEAKFFRAYNYFYLVKTFGDLPLSTMFYESADQDMYLKRTEAKDVYTLIESDLKEAVEVLAPSTFAANGHELTKYAAAMTLANVYLQQEKYADAAKYAEVVTKSSPHALTENTDLAANSAYNKLRKTDDLAEVIYAYEFNESISNSGWWPTYSLDGTATSLSNSYAIYARVYGPTKRFLNVYKEDDLRIKPNQFYHWKYTNPNNNAVWQSDEAGIWYYFDENAVINTGIGTKDWNLYRYAEALLIAAEALAKSSNAVTADAAGYLAEIKARSDTKGKTAAAYASELQAMPLQKFVEEVWTERLRELPLEFKMWDDCLRTQMFPVISETTKGEVTYQPLVGAKNASGATIKQTDLLWPISLDELQRNPALHQNDGYQSNK